MMVSMIIDGTGVDGRWAKSMRRGRGSQHPPECLSEELKKKFPSASVPLVDRE